MELEIEINSDITLFYILFNLQAPKAHVHLNTVKHKTRQSTNAVVDTRADGRKWKIVY